MATILGKNEVELLKQTSVLLEEILETLEVAGDSHASKAVREGLRDMKAGRVGHIDSLSKSSAAP